MLRSPSAREADLPNRQPYSSNLAFRDIHFRVDPEELEACKILEQYARTSLDALKLWPPKSYFFSRSRRCVIAYAVANKVAVSLGDAVGPQTESRQRRTASWNYARPKVGTSLSTEPLQISFPFTRAYGFRK